jgi:phage FluMu gp28-like protein
MDHMTLTARQKVDLWLRRNFVAYQLRWILDTSLFMLALKARQIGFSDATAGRAVYRGFVKRRPQLVLSASQELADEVLDKARTHCRVLAASGVRGASDFAVDNATELAWRGGGRIVALPANPRTARSFSGDVHLDEFAYHADPEAIRDGAFAMASRGNYAISVLSTPNGAQGLFYDWATTPPDGWNLHRVDVDAAVADGFPVDKDKLWKLCGGDERVYAQLYRCAFLDASMQYIPTAFADRARDWIGKLPAIQGADIFAGLDVGRTQDLTALTVVAVVRDVAYVLAVVTCQRSDFRAQQRMVAAARSAFRWQTLHVDQTGIGRGLAEDLIEQWGEEEVIAIDFTHSAKADLATRALRWFRDDRVRFPRGDEGKKLHAETIAVRREVTKAGNVTYEVPRSSQGHGDRWWSLCLALKGAGDPVGPSGMGQSPLLTVA